MSTGLNGQTPDLRDGLQELTVEELLAAHWRFAKPYYSKDDAATKELACMRETLRPVCRLYGDIGELYCESAQPSSTCVELRKSSHRNLS